DDRTVDVLGRIAVLERPAVGQVGGLDRKSPIVLQWRGRRAIAPSERAVTLRALVGAVDLGALLGERGELCRRSRNCHGRGTLALRPGAEESRRERDEIA